jgi:GT2 family glycosyltransferase
VSCEDESPQAHPTASVVIPFIGGIDALFSQLQSLFSQSTRPDEVIVVLNHPASEVRAGFRLLIAREFTNPALRLIEASTRQGAAYARNEGWRTSHGEYVLFCDSDDVVDINWVSAMLDALAQSDLAGGRLSYTALNSTQSQFWTRHSTQELPSKFRHLPFAVTANLGVARQCIASLGGFNEDLPTGEDIDFCWRAQYENWKITFAPDALVNYRLRNSFIAAWRQAYSYGRWDALLLKLHKARGARRPARDSFVDLMTVPWSLAALLVGSDGHVKVALRTGAFLGRLVGSFKEREFAL